MVQRFFWVNHKKTFKAELGGNYIWAPKREINGAFNQTYENLTYVQPGDIIFSFAGAEIKAIGCANSECYEAIKPGGFADNWADLGWRVDVDFIQSDMKFKPKLYIEEFKHLLPPKYSPMNAEGNGNQKCYLAEISPQLAYYLYSKLESVDKNIILFDYDDSFDDLSETVKETVVLQRIGQNVFRKKLLEIYKDTCALTNIQLPILLRASHIKPWSKSDPKERLDPTNGILLAAHIDVLFDRGLISFNDNGTVLMANRSVTKLFQEYNIPLVTSKIPENSRAYLSWHRENVFKKE